MTRLFILSIATGYGGAERSIETMLPHFPSDIEVRVYAAHPEHIRQLSRPGLLPPNVKLICLPEKNSIANNRMAMLRLSADYLRYRPKAILVNTHMSALIAAMVAKLIPDFGRRCHLFVRDFLWEDLDYIFGRLSGAKVLMPSAVVGERIGYLNPFYFSPSDATRCRIVPDMVDLPAGDVSYDGPILQLATINRWKGHADLMLALRHLKAKTSPVDVRSAGMIENLSFYEQLLAFKKSAGIEDQITFLGYVPDPASLLRTCRAVAVTSVSHSGGPETFCRAVIEAWVYRKPVVAYAAGAPKHLITHGVDGLLVPEGDTEALAEALHQVWSSPSLCRRLGEAGYAKVVERYQASAVTQQLLTHLNLGPRTQA